MRVTMPAFSTFVRIMAFQIFRFGPANGSQMKSGDSLSSMTFDGNPLRSYMLFADLASESSSDPAWLVLSLFADDRIELRIMRRNNLYGVFQLQRQE